MRCQTYTHSIDIPASLTALAVPPDPTSLTPAWVRPFAKSMRPFLSETERRAGMFVYTYQIAPKSAQKLLKKKNVDISVGQNGGEVKMDEY